MPNPASTADVVSRWRPLSDQETTNAETLLGDAWRMLKRALAAQGVTIEDEIESDEDLRGETVRILVTAVLRVLKNPDGKSREQIDDYSWALDESVAGGLLFFRDDELDALVPGSGGKGRAFSVNLLAGWEPA